MPAVPLNIPNAITLGRLALLPVVLWLLAAGDYPMACALFVVCAAGDLFDGWLARRLDQVTTAGAWLDPAVDKLTMFTVTVLLGWQGLIPVWLVALVVARDVLIVGGTFAYRSVTGSVTIAPTRLSKFNTLVEFSVVSLVLANAALWLDLGALLPWAYLLLLATLVASGAHYVWVWGRRALRGGSDDAGRSHRLGAPPPDGRRP
jgi:cardiolipin synthase